MIKANKMLACLAAVGYTQSQLAELLGVNQSTISRLLAGTQTPTLAVYAKLIAVYSVIVNKEKTND